MKTITNFIYVTTNEEYVLAIDKLSKYTELAGDSETYALKEHGERGSALDPHTGRISLLILKGRKGKTYIFDILWLQHNNVDWELLKNLLVSRDWILFHHAKFDLKMIVSTLEYLLTNVRDTMIMAQLLSNSTGSKFGRSRGSSYKDLCRDLFNIHVGGKGKEQVTEWGIGIQSRNLDNEWWLGKLNYAAGDVKYLFPIHDTLLPWIINPLPNSPLTQTGEVDNWGYGMSEVLEREFKYIPLLAEREYRGIAVSKAMINSIQRAINERVEDLAAELSLYFGLDSPTENPFGDLRASGKAMKHLRSSSKLLRSIQDCLRMEKLDNVQGKVLSRILEIMDSLSSINNEEEEEGKNQGSAFIDEAEEELYSELKDIETCVLVEITPIMKDVIEFKSLLKQHGMNIMRYINPVTNRIHPSLKQLGTATGRLSCIAEGQRVMIPGGWIYIEDIKVGDQVYCYLNNKLTVRPVLNVWFNGTQDTIEVLWQSRGLNGTTGSLICTPDHKILSKSGEWVEASSLKRYQKVKSLSEGEGAADGNHSVSSINEAGMRKVYDIEVEDAHNFIAEEICVHNCTSPNLQQISHRLELEVSIPLDYLFNSESKGVVVDVTY